MCQFLVECKADVNAKDNTYDFFYALCNFSKYHAICRHIHFCETHSRAVANQRFIWHVKKAMLKYLDFSSIARQMWMQKTSCATPLILHPDSNALVALSFILNRPCSDKSPLLLFCEKGHVEMCRFLVECKADVNAKDKGYNSSPHSPLFEHTCNIWLSFCFWHSCSCKSALHCWSEQGHVEMCQFLLECKADVNAKDAGCDGLLDSSSF